MQQGGLGLKDRNQLKITIIYIAWCGPGSMCGMVGRADSFNTSYLSVTKVYWHVIGPHVTP